MKKSEKESEKRRIDDEFDMITGSTKSLDVEQYIMKPEELSDFGPMEEYDYLNDIESTKEQAKPILEDLVSLYVPEIKDHPYLIRKINEDARIYSKSLFLEKMVERLFIKQMKQVDNGDSSARIFEVINQTIKEIRETNKDGRTARTEIEKIYKEMRKDLGLNELSASSEFKEESTESTGRIIDTSELNNRLEELLKNKDEKKK